MTKLDQRANIRVSETDKQMAKTLSEKLNIKESDVWRYALKSLFDATIDDTKGKKATA